MVIYVIKNSINKKVYIGSSKNFKERKIRHIVHLKNNKHCNIKLQRFYNKYGRDCLWFEILEHCSESNFLSREQYYIDLFNACKTGFNILPVAGTWLNKKHSKATKLKQSASKIGKQTTGMLGKKHTNETKDLIRNKSLGRKQSADTILKRVIKNTGKKRPQSAIETLRVKLSKLSDEQVIEIRRSLSIGVFQSVIASQFGVCQRSISRIKQRISYFHI